MIAHNLPVQPTPFVGRQTELNEIQRLLSEPACRLLTLIGPGGIGKTRLALEAARLLVESPSDHSAFQPRFEVNDRLKDGLYFVPLQSLTSSDFIVPTIADALHFTFYGEGSPKTQLLHYLREKHLLLLLDNFEHLLDGVDLLPELLEHAPGVKLLVTSRERLHLLEEWVLDVSGLAYPEHDALKQVDDYSAVQLFIQSARRAGYIPSPADNASIIHLCQLVEGIPLAIELAATWVRVMPCAEITREVAGSLDILTSVTRNVPAKHQSMRAVFDHSWKLLSDHEQGVFRRLSVFRGGFTREAAAQIAGASLPTLASLVDKSLLRMDPRGRYDVHELLQQYAREKLAEAGEAQDALNRHRDYFLAFAERGGEELFGPDQLDWLDRMETELGNLRAAIGWSQDNGDVPASLRLTSSLYWLYAVHGYHREGYERLMEILSLPQARFPTAERGKALFAAGFIQWFDGNYEAARPLLEEACTIAREAGNLRELVSAVRALGHTLLGLGEYDSAGLLLEEGLTLARELRDDHNVAWSLVFLGDFILQQGDMAHAQRLYEESIGLLRKLGDTAILAYALRRLGLVMRSFRNYAFARELCQESLELNFATGDRRAVAASLIGLAGLAVAEGDTVHAAQLLAGAERLLNDIAAHLFFPDLFEYARHLASVRSRLDALTLNQAWAEGQAMIFEQVVAFALESKTTPDHKADQLINELAAGQSLAEPLTERELEILRLLASGLSTREVAEQLFLSVGTVRWYTKHIYSKLHVHSRTQAIARAHALNLLG